jgi:hypothetical protein
MRLLGALTVVLALLIALIGFPVYAAPILRIAMAVFLVVGGIGGVALFAGQPLGVTLSLAFLAAVVVFGLLVLLQGALAVGALGAAFRYQLFTTLPALLIAFAFYRRRKVGAVAG